MSGTANKVHEVAADVFLVHGTASNWTVIRDGKAFTLVDCGYPRDARLMETSLAYLGLSPAAASALLITHAHTDHVGSTRALSRLNVPVWCSPDELPNLTGEVRHQVGLYDIYPHLWKPRFVLWTCHAVLAGGLQPCTVSPSRVRTFRDGEPLDVPGRPIPISTPGHTPGHTSYFLPQSSTLITGDALVTAHPVSRTRGPQMLHDVFHWDTATVQRNSNGFVSDDVETVVPGHGPACSGRTAREA